MGSTILGIVWDRADQSTELQVMNPFLVANWLVVDLPL